LKIKANKNQQTEFVPLIIDGRFYIVHLLSDSLLYLHCDLYTRPDDVGYERYHHRVEILNPCDDKNFQLVVIQTNIQPSIVWILVLEAALWFRNFGIADFKANY
jgi:hypothetical protein